jgi:transposase
MEACGSAHYWAREIAKLGHSVKLMPPKYVKAYVKRGKTDAGDAAAICEAVTRPSMSFVPVKGLEQQGLSMLHSARRQLIGQRTAPDRNRRHANSALDAGAPSTHEPLATSPVKIKMQHLPS